MNALVNLTIADTAIRTDDAGRFSFNDLHKAAVAAGHDYKTCQVEHFTRNEATQALIVELRKNGELEIDPYVSTVGRYGGTWGCKELVYAYAMWISPAFHLKVIRAYDAMVTQPRVELSRMDILKMAIDSEQRALALEAKAQALEHQIEEQAPKVAALDRFASHNSQHNMRNSAKVLGVQEFKFKTWLLAHRWFYRDHNGRLCAYADKIADGLLDTEPVEIMRSAGVQIVPQPVITQKGLARLAVLLVKAGLLPTREAIA